MNVNLTQTLTNPDPDHNPNPSRKSKNNVCSTKRHRIIVQQSFIYTSYFPRDGGGLIKGL